MTFYIPVRLGKSETGRRRFLTIKFVSLHQYSFSGQRIKTLRLRLNRNVSSTKEESFMSLSKFGRQLTTDEGALTMSELQLFSVNLLRDRHPALFLTSSLRNAKFKSEKPRKGLVLMQSFFCKRDGGCSNRE